MLTRQDPVDVPWAEFAPDLSDYSPQFSSAIKNVEPAPDGYRALPGLGATLASLPAACRGAITVRKTNGVPDVYAGTQTRLYKFNRGTSTWDNVTRVSGGDYSLSTGRFWSMAQYGPRLIVTGGSDDVQYIDVDSGTNFAALPNAPRARYVAASNDFIFLGALISDERHCASSGVNNSEFWTYGQRGSAIFKFPDGGLVQGIIPYAGGAIVFHEEKLRIIERVGSGTLVWSTRILHERVGCLAPASITQTRNTFGWLSQQGFHVGIDAQNVGNDRVNDYVLNQSTPALLELMQGTNDPQRQMFRWLVTKPSSVKFMLGYDYALNKWAQADVDVDYIFGAVTPGYTIDQMTNASSTIDGLPYPTDSVFWSDSSKQVLAGFSNGTDYQLFASTNLEATLETADLQLGNGGYAFLQGIRHIGNATNGNITHKTNLRAYPGGTASGWSSSISPDSNSGIAWEFSRAQTHRIRTTIAASNWNNTKGLQCFVEEGGFGNG